MTRHSKNCTAHTVYTYHERKRDTKLSGYGTQEIRLGKDSVRGFDCCCLTLQPAQDPVVTPNGYLYDRAAILEYIVKNKADYQRKLKIYEKQKARIRAEAEEEEKRQHEEEARRFLSMNTLDTHAKASAQAAEAEALATLTSRRSTSAVSGAVSFWTPGALHSDNRRKLTDADLKKPDPIVRCPMSGQPLKYKDLVSVKFTTFKEDDEAFAGKQGKSTIARDLRYCCAVSKDPLTNATACLVLSTSGAVVTKEVYDTVIASEMIDPLNGKPIKPGGVIELQRGSLGYADERVILIAKRQAPCMQT